MADKGKPPVDPEDNTETRILDAARQVFVRRGTAGARMQEIAETAGVNQALVHYYYRTKDRLAQAVFRGVAAHLIPSALKVLASDLPLPEKVERFVHLYIDGVRQHPYIPGYILSELHHHPQRLTSLLSRAGIDLQAHAAPLIARLDAQLAEAAARGEMRPMTAPQFLVNMMGLCVIPFVARPMLEAVVGMDQRAFDAFLDQRRRELPPFILAGMRP